MQSLKHLNKYFWKYKWRLILGLLFAVLSTCFGVYIAVLVRKAADFMSQAVSHKYSFEITAAELLKYGLLILGTTVISGLLMFLMRQAIIVMSRHIEYDLKNEIFSHYQLLDMAFYRRNSTGDLMNRISEDVSRVRMYIGPAIMYFAGTIATIFLVAGTMTSVNVKLALYVLVPLPVLVIVIYFVSDLINKMSAAVQEQLSKISTMAQESFSGIRVLKAYAQEDNIQRYFNHESEEYRKTYLKLILTEALFSPFILLLMGISTLMTLYFGGKLAIEGQISYGNIVEYVIYVAKLTWPVASLGWVTSLVQRAAASQERINEFLNTKPAIITPSVSISETENHTNNMADALDCSKGINIEFRNVSFTYPDSGMKALINVSFKVSTGLPVAIIGKTGSGKSTIAGLICRLYDVTEGEILINGKNIKAWNLSLLRRQIGYVPQETFLFSDTLENNIAFGAQHTLGKSVNPEVMKAAKNAGIYDEIMRFPSQFHTRIGERGITLSGGQKQRVSIARAIISSPNVLIFDDCLSAVDTETEAKILGNLRKIMVEKATILVSHRVSAVKNAAHIIVLNHGEIAEEGIHQQLLGKGGFYYRLYEMQLKEQSEAAGKI